MPLWRFVISLWGQNKSYEWENNALCRGNDNMFYHDKEISFDLYDGASSESCGFNLEPVYTIILL